MRTALPEDVLAFGQSARARMDALGGVRLALQAETDPLARDQAGLALAELGAWDIDPRAGETDLLAAAELCRAVGASVLPYPVVEQLLAVEGGRLALLDPARPRVDHGDLAGPWVGVGLDGRARVAECGARTGSRLGPFVVPAVLGRPLPESLVVLDAAAARVGTEALGAAFGRLDRVRDMDDLGKAIRLADGRAESPLESASRGVILSARLPRPARQQWVPDDEGRLWRVAFLWRDPRVIGEADGWIKYQTFEDLRAEKRREDALRRAGWTIVRWTSDELWQSPQLVVARIARALARVR